KVETKDKLEKQLNQRPGRSELVEKNILKDDKGVAPALIANMEKLKRSQLENKLDHALQHRPKPDELVKDGILQGAVRSFVVIVKLLVAR
ncbi:hypothetical protein BD626DRAFT_393348, partial [Schizophyllum amplum]